MKQKEEGITLIALIITIIILIILTAITISNVMGSNLFGLAKGAVDKYKDEAQKEQNALENIYQKMEAVDEKNTDEYVSVSEIFDENGKDENAEGYNSNKLHIGDFINYDAGIWTEDEINEIKVGKKNNLVPANNSLDLPNIPLQFGGFTVGKSRNDTTKSEDSYLIDENELPVGGWRLFDVTSNNELVLISAGCPESYYDPTDLEGEYLNCELSYYIFTGVDKQNDNFAENYTSRNWDVYVKKEQGALNAKVLTKDRLDEWGMKYLNVEWNHVLDMSEIMGNRYTNLIKLNRHYWTLEGPNSDFTYIDPDALDVSTAWNVNYGFRILVTLSSNIKIKNKPYKTKTVIDSENNENSGIYNVWDITL